MTSAARTLATPVLRTASGEPPLGRDGAFFRDDQGEILEHDSPQHRSRLTQIGILALQDGQWISMTGFPPIFNVSGPRFDSRDHALRTAIAAVVRRGRQFGRNGEGQGLHWSEGKARSVIEWALSLKPQKNGTNNKSGESEQNLNTVSDGAGSPVADNPDDPTASRLQQGLATPNTDGTADESPRGELRDVGNVAKPEEASGRAPHAPPAPSDPIVASLLAAHRAREVFPAGHTFAMTNPVMAGEIKTVGTCICGHAFIFPGGDTDRMDAAIEAHWQTFDHLPEKVDGLGQPIPSSDGGVEGHAHGQSSRTSGSSVVKSTSASAGIKPGPSDSPTDAGGQSPASGPAPDFVPSSGAGEIQAAQICASNEPTTNQTAKSDDAWDALPPDVRAQAEADGTEDLLKAAMGLAWQATPAPRPIIMPPGKVERPVLRWHGGKWKIAPWVMSFFPAHRIYVEPFGGAGSVLLRKPRCYAEVYNDLDEVVINLFRVLRDDAKAARLVAALKLTPFAREEFNDALLDPEDDVERARHLIVRGFMGFGSNAHSSSPTADKTGFKSFTRPADQYRSTGFRANSNRSGTTPAHDWANYPNSLPAIIERLRGVIVESRPAIDVMRQHDGEATLHYVDPPYLPETRSPANKYDLKHRMYRHELTVDDHVELLAFLQTLTGYVVLSGYPSPLYDDALTGWRRVTCATHADGARERTEVLWINPACAAALDAEEPRLFDLASLDVANTPPCDKQAEADAE